MRIAIDGAIARGGASFTLMVLATVSLSCDGRGGVSSSTQALVLPAGPQSDSVIHALRSLYWIENGFDNAGNPSPRYHAILGDSEVINYSTDAVRGVVPHFASDSPSVTHFFKDSATRTIVDSRGSSLGIQVQDGAGVPSETSNQFLVYRSGLAGADIVVRPEREAHQDFFVFQQKPAAESVAYVVTPSADLSLRHVGHILEFIDGNGQRRFAVADAAVIDSTGKRYSLDVNISGCTVDTDPKPPAGRHLPLPGAPTCVLSFSWSDKAVVYPAVFDPTWSSGSSMAVARSGQTMILCNGIVYAIGGDYGSSSTTAEYFNPENGLTSSWTATSPLSIARQNPIKAVCVSSLNKIVVTSGGDFGSDDGLNDYSTSESLNIASGTWHLANCNGVSCPTNWGPHILIARKQASMTYVSDTQILVSGGITTTGTARTPTVAKYDATTDSWLQSSLAQMNYGRAYHASVAPDGTHLVVLGGTDLNGNIVPYDEVYDISNDKWTAWSSPGWRSSTVAANQIGPFRYDIPDGETGLTDYVGGLGFVFDYSTLSYRSSTTLPTHSHAGNPIAYAGALAPLQNGYGLADAGGSSCSYLSKVYTSSFVAFTAVDLYDKSLDTWTASAAMQIGRGGPGLIQLPTGPLLVAGGVTSAQYDNGNACGWFTGPADTSTEYMPLGQSGTSCASNIECASGACVNSVCAAQACTLNTDCVTGSYCAGGNCVSKLNNGGACSSGTSCKSGNCVDGLCCDTTCANSCDACSVAGHEGTCTPVLAGADGSPTCANNYVCDGTNVTCPLSCTADAGCATGYYCATSGTCAPQKAQGSACALSGMTNTDCYANANCRECATGFCAQNVCCNTACDGDALSSGNFASCDSCAVAGSLGTCTTIGGCAPPNMTLPPEPSTYATQSQYQPQPGVATNFADYSCFLYSGSGIQTGAGGCSCSSTCLAFPDLTRIAVIRGHVLSSGGVALPGVAVTVREQSLIGQTLTRTDGAFDLAVNAAGLMTVSFQANGFIPVQRQVSVPNSGFAIVPDVTMLPYGSTSTNGIPNRITFPSSVAQALTGPAATGDIAPRTTNVLFPANATAQITYDSSGNCTSLCPGTCNGTNVCTVSQLTMHQPVEFTQSSSDSAMPGTLPASSAYTFAVDITADEFLNSHVVSNSFGANPSLYPVAYVDDFLGFPQVSGGTQVTVPAGYYDNSAGVWKPGTNQDTNNTPSNGQIINILSVAGNIATIDSTGSGIADNPQTFSNDERQQLAVWYSNLNIGNSCQFDSDCLPAGSPPNTPTGGRNCVASGGGCAYRVWRTRLPHFTGWDMNWGVYPPANASYPAGSPSVAQNVDDPNECHGSIIECQNQVLGETIPIAGTKFSLNYRTSRALGFASSRTINVPLRAGSPPSNVQAVDVQINIAGRPTITYNSLFANAPPVYSYTWDGKDAYGNRLYGLTQAQVRVGYEYAATYARTNKFGYYGGSQITTSGGKGTPVHQQTFTFWGPWTTVDLFQWDSRGVGLGGWDLDVHNTYDPHSLTLLLGNGHKKSFGRVHGGVLQTLAPSSSFGANFPFEGPPIATAADGSVYVIDYNGGAPTIKYVTPAGAVNAYYTLPAGWSLGPMTVAPDKTIYTVKGWSAGTDNNQIYKLTPAGGWSVIANTTGQPMYTYQLGQVAPGDGGPASQAQFAQIDSLAYGPDGSLYVGEGISGRIRRITPDGIITTVYGDSASNVNASTSNGDITYLAVGNDGTIYFTTANGGATVVRKLTPQGLPVTLFGGGQNAYQDGQLGSSLSSPLTANGLGVAADGNLYVLYGCVVRGINPDGYVFTAAGGTTSCQYGADNGPAVGNTLSGHASALTVGPEDAVYIVDTGNIRKVTPGRPAPPLFVNGTYSIASGDGREIYTFDSTGRHQTTTDFLTGGNKYTFCYDAVNVNQLTAVLETDDNSGITCSNYTTISGPHRVTQITHGTPILVTGPYGHVTKLSLDNNNYLSAVTDPTNVSFELASSSVGLLSNLIDPKNQEHVFTYDGLGRLVSDRNPAGEIQTLTSPIGTQTNPTLSYGTSSVGVGWTEYVSRTTALSHTATYKTEPWKDGYQRTTTLPTLPNGPYEVTQTAGDLSQNEFSPDGYPPSSDGSTTPTLQLSFSGDPRFGLESPYVSKSIWTPTYQSQRTTTVNRIAYCAPPGTCSPGTTPCNSSNSSNVIRQTDTVNINGTAQSYTVDYQQCPSGAAGRTLTITTPVGRVKNYYLDPFGRVTKEAWSCNGGANTCNVNPINYIYDNYGRVGDPNSTIASPLPAIIVGTGTDQRTTMFAYCADAICNGATGTGGIGQLGKIVATNISGNLTTTFAQYDSAARVLSTTLPGNGVVSSTYDSNGNPYQVTVPSNNVYSFQYDGEDALATYTPPTVGGTQAATHYDYDAEHHIAQIGRPDGDNIYFTYDSFGRVASVEHPVSSFSFTYDSKGRAATANSSPGEELTFGYGVTPNDIGSIVRDFTWSGTVSGHVHRDFDNFQRLSTECLPAVGASDCSTASNTVNFTYDDDGLLCAATPGANPPSCSSNAYTTWNPPLGTFVVHYAGSPVPMNYTANDTYNNGLLAWTQFENVSDAYTYATMFPEPSQYLASCGGTTLLQRNYSRDNLGRLTQVTDYLLGTQVTYNYNYDPSSGRLASVVNATNNMTVESYSYDSDGNRIAPSTNQLNTASQLTGSPTWDAQDHDRLLTYPSSNGTYTYTYTLNGERASRAVSGAGTTSYTYDGFGNLVSVVMPNGTKIDYVIDGQNRRVGKKINGNLKQAFLYDSRNRIVAELDGFNNLVSQFVYATDSRVPDYMIRAGSPYRILRDHLGSVRLVVGAASLGTPAAGTCTQIAYDSFGNVVGGSNCPSTPPYLTSPYAPPFQPFGFAGGLYDADTKLIRFGARDYDPEIGRWVSKDPVRFRGGDVNLYSYCKNDPINCIDPSGLDPGDGWLSSKLFDMLDMFNVRDYAEMREALAFPAGGHNDAADAYRHCVASCEGTRRNGSTIAELFGDLNEIYGNLFHKQSEEEEQMDDHNNSCGVNYGRNASDPQDCLNWCDTGTRDGTLITSIPTNDRPYPYTHGLHGPVGTWNSP